MKLFHKLNGKWSEVTSSDGGNSSDINLPEDGIDGQILSKDSSSESGLKWVNQNKTEYPSDGSNGQVLIHDDTTSTGAKWGIVKNPHKLNVGDVFYTLAENPPSNCLMLDNQTLDKNEYAELYSVIGDSGIINYHKKYIFDEYTYEEQSSRISNITSDLSLGEESYYSAVIDNKIKVSSIGVNGGIHASFYPWYVLNTFRLSTTANPVNAIWHTPSNHLGKTFHLDFEFLDGTKISPYKYCIVVWNGNTSYNYYPTYWELKGWNTETSSWDILDTYTEGVDEKPVCDETSYSYYKIDSYDNTKFYSKFRLSAVAPSHAIAISRFNIFGTKEGESNIYDMFMLPSASTNELNAKAYIVASSTEVIGDEIYSEEETIIGTWINGKPIYRRTFQGTTADTILSQDTNFETLINQYGYFVIAGYQVLFPCVHSNNQLYFRINETTHQLLLYAVGGYVNMPYAATVEYTKTID